MKKLTIKNTFTKVSFKKVNAEMQVIDSIKILPGKVNDKNAIKELENEDYLTKSVKIEVVTDLFKIPYDILEMVINASLNGGFVDTENKETDYLHFNKPIAIRTAISPLNINKIEIVEFEEATEKVVEGETEKTVCKEGYMIFKSVELPQEVFNHIIKEYVVK